MKFIVLVGIWVISVILVSLFRPSYLVEGTANHLGFEFASKEAYVTTVNLVSWSYALYFAVLALVTFLLFQRQNRWQ